jgi:hypothetical protein
MGRYRIHGWTIRVYILAWAREFISLPRSRDVICGLQCNGRQEIKRGIKRPELERDNLSATAAEMNM